MRTCCSLGGSQDLVLQYLFEFPKWFGITFGKCALEPLLALLRPFFILHGAIFLSHNGSPQVRNSPKPLVWASQVVQPT